MIWWIFQCLTDSVHIHVETVHKNLTKKSQQQYKYFHPNIDIFFSESFISKTKSFFIRNQRKPKYPTIFHTLLNDSPKVRKHVRFQMNLSVCWFNWQRDTVKRMKNRKKIGRMTMMCWRFLSVRISYKSRLSMNFFFKSIFVVENPF